MNQIIYTLQFTGGAAPKAGATGVMKATTSASSASFTTTITPDGVSGAMQTIAGGTATFESEVTLTSESAFLETGTIRFGSGNSALRFSTVGQGFLGASSNPKLQAGSVIWRVDGGEGQFAGATGLITSNFTLSDKGEVTDNQLGIIFVK